MKKRNIFSIFLMSFLLFSNVSCSTDDKLNSQKDEIINYVDSEIDSLSNELINKINETLTKINELENNYNDKVNELEKINLEIKEIQTIHDENIKTLNAEIANIKSENNIKNKELQECINDLQSDIDLINSQLEELNNLHEKDIEELNKAKENLLKEIESIKEDINSINTELSKIDELEKEYNEKVQELDDLLNEIKTNQENHNERIESLNTELENIKKEYNEKNNLMQESLTLLESKITSINLQIETLNSSFEKNIKELNEAKENILKEIETIKTQINTLNTELNKEISDVKSSVEELMSVVTSENLKINTELNNIYTLISTLEDLVNTNIQKIVNIETKLNELDARSCEEHNFTDWKIGLKETCTSIGYNYRECTNCDKVEYKFIEAQGHSVNSWIRVSEDCKYSLYYGECNTCLEASLKLGEGHGCGNESFYTNTVDSTCITKGHYDYVCGECHEVYYSESLELNPKNHEGSVVDGKFTCCGNQSEYDLNFGVGIIVTEPYNYSYNSYSSLDISFSSVIYDGNIVLSSLVDEYSLKLNNGEPGIIESSLNTKKDQHYNYGMANFSPIYSEWFEQAAALENYTVGKSNFDSTSDELLAGCTMYSSEILNSISEAKVNSNDVSLQAGEYTFALGHSISTTFDSENEFTIEITIAGLLLDSSSKIATAYIDAVQIPITFTKGEENLYSISPANNYGAPYVQHNFEGQVIASKKELGYNYGMKSTSEMIGIGAEWFEQAAAWENYIVGKSVSELADIYDVAGCTMLTDMFVVACENAVDANLYNSKKIVI